MQVVSENEILAYKIAGATKLYAKGHKISELSNLTHIPCKTLKKYI